MLCYTVDHLPTTVGALCEQNGQQLFTAIRSHSPIHRSRLLGHCAWPVCAGLGGDLNTAWRLSFSNESTLEVSVTQDVLYKLTSYLYLLPLPHLFSPTTETQRTIPQPCLCT